jgi:uncharacterized protein YndB with AHSA1/START domain
MLLICWTPGSSGIGSESSGAIGVSTRSSSLWKWKIMIREAVIEADPMLPVIRIARDFAATPAQLLRAHTDPELFVRWVGPDGLTTRIDHWDARSGGSWRYVSGHYWFRGCFHDIRPDRIVQTFTYEGNPDGVALQTLWFEDLGGNRTRLRTQSLVDSFESRDAWLRSDMATGINQGYAKLERMVIDDTAR